jgi:hypothetical protein|tara:strand:+ start:107 stop:412 length:306 start_codon:yes stop_codon:yes gene_type:complete
MVVMAHREILVDLVDLEVALDTLEALVLELVIHSQVICQILSLQMVGDMMVPLVPYLLTMDLVEAVELVVLALLEHLVKVDLVAQVFKFHQHLEIHNLQPH